MLSLAAEKLYLLFLFYFTDINASIYIYILYSVKYRDFLIINNLAQILHAFILLYKYKLKVQNEGTICVLCANV